MRARLKWDAEMWCWPQKYRGVDGMIYILRDYESEVHFVRKLLRPGQVVVDVGANIGFYSVLMARCVSPGGKVYAFEPAEETFQMLWHNLDWNDITNVHVMNVALSEQDGQRTLFVAEDRGRNSFAPETQVCGEQVVECRRLDGLLTGAQCDFVKIDVEGAELLVLRGGARFFRESQKSILMCEFNAQKTAAMGLELGELIDCLKSMDRELYYFDYPRSRLVPILDAQRYHGNVIAVHRDHIQRVATFL